jgi:hypothetical protein
VDTGATEGVSVLRSKLAGESGSRASMLIVLQLVTDMFAAIWACGLGFEVYAVVGIRGEAVVGWLANWIAYVGVK